jgi:nucleoside-diphosphate-sugar epimerase
MSARREVHLLGARGPLGTEILARLSRETGVVAHPWSGAPGDSSYAEFLRRWRERPDRDALVLFAGGRVGGDAATIVAEHVARTASCIDAFDAAGWPRRALVLSSAAELLPASVYGIAKRTQRELVAAAGRTAGARVVALRVHSVIPRMRPVRGLFGDLLRQFEAGGAVRVRHFGGARDYVTSAQVATIVAACVAADAAWESGAPPVVDVGNCPRITVPDWVKPYEAVHR